MKTRSLWMLLLSGSCLMGLMLSGCTVSEVGTSPPNADLPRLLPAIRLSNRSVVTIDSLDADNTDDTVAIAGTIAARVALLEGWLYQVQDETGRVWVLSNSTKPEVGQSATVEGVVRYEAIVVDEIDAGEIYLEEKAYRQGEQ